MKSSCCQMVYNRAGDKETEGEGGVGVSDGGLHWALVKHWLLSL